MGPPSEEPIGLFVTRAARSVSRAFDSSLGENGGSLPSWVVLASLAGGVLDAQTDGVYFENSIGLVEDSQVLNSLNTGVSFFGCPNGGTIRNSLVRGSVHQGVAVSVDPVSGRSSHGVRVVDNTLVDNVIANLLVDERSDAVVQGNVFSLEFDRNTPLASYSGTNFNQVEVQPGIMAASLGTEEVVLNRNLNSLWHTIMVDPADPTYTPALGQAFAPWLDGDPLLVEVLLNGRNTAFDDIDL